MSDAHGPDVHKIGVNFTWEVPRGGGAVRKAGGVTALRGIFGSVARAAVDKKAQELEVAWDKAEKERDRREAEEQFEAAKARLDAIKGGGSDDG